MENNVIKAAKVIEQVNNVILGKDREVKEIMAAFLAGGHILLEDIPGVGKTGREHNCTVSQWRERVLLFRR